MATNTGSERDASTAFTGTVLTIPDGTVAAEPTPATDIRKNLGIGVALLGPDSIYKDELQAVFGLWKEKKYTEAQDLFYTTKFSKLSTDARSRYLLKLENTDLYKQSLKSFAVSIKQALTLNGLSLTDKEIEDYYIKGTPENLILDDALTAFSSKPGAKPKGQIGENLATLKQVAAANGLDINNNFGSSIDEWLKNIANGESIETYKQVIRDTAKRGLPDKVAALLDKGVDLEAIYSPYRNAMASILEVNPQTITLDDPTLRMAIGPDKEMSLYDFQRTLRKDNRWQYTDKAREEVSSITQNVLRDFGFQG